MRIGLSIRTFYPKSGGLQAHAEKLAHELQARGHQVVIVTRSIFHTPSYLDYYYFSESQSYAEINGLPIDILRHPRSLNAMMWFISKCIGRSQWQSVGIQLLEWMFVRQAIAAFQGVDAIHHVGQADELIGFVAAAAARSLGVPFLVQPTTHPGQWGDSPFDLCLYGQADKLLVHTQYERQFLEACGLSQSFEVVGNGIEDRSDGDADRFRKTYGIEGAIVLFLGRKSIDKGYDLVLQAFHQVWIERPDATLVCMGPSAADKSVSGAIAKQEGVIELSFGQDIDKQDALAACTMLCVPSEGESFGLVYMEAGRYAKPVIGRKIPVLEELLGQQGAGLLVGKSYGIGNQVVLEPEALKTAILSLLDNSEFSEQLGENARRVSAEFIWSKVVTRFEDAYGKAIEAAVSGSLCRTTC